MRKGKKGRLFAFCMAISMAVNILFSSTIPVSAEATADENGFVIEDGVLTKYEGNAENVVVPEGVTKIGEWAFHNCSSLESIELPGSMTSIGNYAFLSCSRLESIELPESVTSIGNLTFSECSSLESITLPGVMDIGYDAFSGCSSLESIGLPSVTSIGHSAFYNCSSLKSIELPIVKNIGYSAFSSCRSLKSIELPGSATSIGEDAFSGCSSLEAINVAEENKAYASIDGVLYTKDKTELLECPKGKTGSVELPGSVTSIEEHEFYGCSSLEAINVAEDNIVYASVDGVLYTKDKTELIECPGGKTGSVKVPEGVTSIRNAFEDCSNLKSIELPGSVTSIGGSAFSGCSSLEAINVAEANMAYASVNGVLYTKDKTELLECPEGKTEKIVVPESVMSIGNYAFSGCGSLESIEVPESVVSIGDYAFVNCGSLETINVAEENTVYASENGILYTKDKTKLLQCPGGKTEKIEVPEGVTSIGEAAFRNCSNLKIIELSGSVTSIGKWAFQYCGSLESIEMSGVTSIEEGEWISGETFSGCDKLTIYGSVGSYVETYAKEHQIPFTTLGLEMKKESTDDAYILGSGKGITITCSGSLSDLVNVYVDGVLVDKANYTVTEGSTIVTFAKEFMETLSRGKHIFTLEYTEGRKSEAAVTVSEPEFTLGDVDGDGKMTTSDALAILKHLARLPQKEFIEAAANVDGEGGITTQDALMILKCLAGLAQMPAATF